jgi:hypothetical protein
MKARRKMADWPFYNETSEDSKVSPSPGLHTLSKALTYKEGYPIKGDGQHLNEVYS